MIKLNIYEPYSSINSMIKLNIVNLALALISFDFDKFPTAMKAFLLLSNSCLNFSIYFPISLCFLVVKVKTSKHNWKWFHRPW